MIWIPICLIRFILQYKWNSNGAAPNPAFEPLPPILHLMTGHTPSAVFSVPGTMSTASAGSPS
jgi:hypothetical protein